MTRAATLIQRLRFRRVFVVLTLGVFSSVAAYAQASPIDSVLNQAQNALDATQDYALAATLAQQVVGVTDATLAQRQRARVIIASAWYPLEAPAKRKHAEALKVLQDAVRADLDFRIKADVTWPALDSLLDEARRTGFSVKVSAPATQEVAGNALATIAVRANKPTPFRLTVARPGERDVMVIDSLMIPAAGGAVHFPVMTNGKAVFQSGTYDVRVAAFDPAKRDSIVVQYTATISAADFTLEPVPTEKTLKLLPERAGKTGLGGLKSALLVGGVIFIASSVLKADSVDAKFSSDVKGLPVAAIAAGAVMLFSYRDPGQTLTANIATNQRSRASLASEITRVTSENAQKVANYHATVLLKEKP